MEKDERFLEFPEGFLWGASTSAHQVEGGTRNQWSEWEKKNAKRLAEKAKTCWQAWQREKFPEMLDPENYVSGRACDHYHRYEEDFDLAKSLSHNAHRFSLEWSRIEPEEGRFDDEEIEHYRKVIRALKARGLEPFVCLWHWTNPLWLERKGGCKSKDFVYHFRRYAEHVASELGDEFRFWLTINEPTSVIASSYVSGAWPPQKKSLLSAWRLYRTFAQAHIAAYEAIHEACADARVGFANMLHSFDPYRKGCLLDKLMVRIGRYLTNRRMIDLTRGFNDFLTVQYYFHNRFKFPKKIRTGELPVSDLDWDIYPHGIYRIIMKLKEHGLPIYVTENGLADARDSKREDFIRKHLKEVHRAIREGADVRGYFHWSLLDNFEWDKGFWPRFGLVEVDRRTLERKVRPSARKYAEICRENGLEA